MDVSAKFNTTSKVLVPPSTRSARMAATLSDPSVLRPSISVSITGMKQAVKIKNYLLNECNVIYECKTCFNMFRSVGNLVAHKRSFCKTRLQDVKHVYRRDPGEYSEAIAVEEAGAAATTAFVEPEPVDTIIPESEFDLAQYSPSLELLREAGYISEIKSRPLVPSLMPKGKKNLSAVVQMLRDRQEAGPERGYFAAKENEEVVRLQRMKHSRNAVFQTYGEGGNSMGERYLEMQRLRQCPPVFLGPDGKVVDPGPPPHRFAPDDDSDDSASGGHKTRYPCPGCSRKYKTIFCVQRHLQRFHGLSTHDAKKLVRQSVRTAQIAAMPTSAASYPCAGCGKSFRSKQGVASHDKFCNGVQAPGMRGPKRVDSAYWQPTVVLRSQDDDNESDVVDVETDKGEEKEPVPSTSKSKDETEVEVIDLGDDDDDEVTIEDKSDKDSGIMTEDNKENDDSSEKNTKEVKDNVAAFSGTKRKAVIPVVRLEKYTPPATPEPPAAKRMRKRNANGDGSGSNSNSSSRSASPAPANIKTRRNVNGP